jgi:integrase
VHRCLHRALAQAVTWRLLACNVATDATPPPRHHRKVVALAPEQVALLLDAADRTTSPWLGPWTMLAAATGARNGELCGLEWADLDLDAGTVRFHQALTIIDPAVLPEVDPDPGGRRKELAIGPVKSAASNAILTLPPFAVQALRQHRRQQARWRLTYGQPQTVTLRRVEPGRPAQPAQLDLVFRTERGTPVNPNHASRAFARLAASIIAAQLRHADGGGLAQRVYIHQLPQTASTVPRGPHPYRPVPCGSASGGGKEEGNPGGHLTEFHLRLPAFVSATAGGKPAREAVRLPLCPL